MALAIENLYKSFDGFMALDRINLSIEESEFVCLLGPSGCGKTTLLRIIAGLLSADGGKMSLDGKDLIPVPAQARGFGIVFQSYSLFPHMTIAQNIGYGLSIRGVAKADINARVQELLAMVHLSDLADRHPNQLSGGQQQRVAIARALAVNPSLLLLDEPLSALDARVRADLRRELREVQQALKIPTLMVTHDQEEAMAMADKIICMDGGRIVQAGSARELYSQPSNRFVAEFMGHSNLLPQSSVQQLAPNLLNKAPNDAAQLFVRPELVGIEADDSGSAHISDVSFLGSIQRLNVRWHDTPVVVETSSALTWQPGQRVALRINPDHCIWMNA